MDNKIKEIYKVGSRIPVKVFAKPGTPFFTKLVINGKAKTCLVVVAYISSRNYTCRNWNTRGQDVGETVEYYLKVIHYYDNNDFVPRLIATEELAKYSEMNRTSELSYRTKWQKDAEEKASNVYNNLQETRSEYADRMGAFYNECANLKIGKTRDAYQLSREYDEVNERRQAAYAEHKSEAAKYGNEISQLNNQNIIPIKWEKDPKKYRVYYDGKIGNIEFLSGVIAFATSNDMIKHNMGLPYDKSFQEAIVIGESNIIKHELGATIYLDGGSKHYEFNDICYEFEMDINGCTVKNIMTYYSDCGPTKIPKELTEQDFAYSAMLLDLLR